MRSLEGGSGASNMNCGMQHAWALFERTLPLKTRTAQIIPTRRSNGDTDDRISEASRLQGFERVSVWRGCENVRIGTLVFKVRPERKRGTVR